MECPTAILSAGGKEVAVYRSPTASAPVVYLNTVRGEGAAVWEACRELGCPAFTLAAVFGLRWDHEMSPWPIPPIAKGDTPCTGGADAYLALLTQEIVPAVEKTLGEKPACRALAGYSLAGLFALYAGCHTDLFDRFASVSGSLWYPGFVAYARGHALRRAPHRIYLSLGDREANTTNPHLRPVERQTQALYEHYRQQGIPVMFEKNPGGHFTQPDWRVAQGLRWLLAPV